MTHQLSADLRKLADIDLRSFTFGRGHAQRMQDALKRAASALDEAWADFLALNEHYANVCGGYVELEESLEDAQAELAELKVKVRGATAVEEQIQAAWDEHVKVKAERDEARRDAAKWAEATDEACEAQLKAEAQAARYREALSWYADPVTYELDEANGYILDAHIPIFEDEGKRARQALSETEETT